MTHFYTIVERTRRMAPVLRVVVALAVLGAVAVGIAAPDEFGAP